MSTQAAIRAALSTISVIVSKPTSGRPSRAAEVPNPVMYTAGNPASSTSRAASGSNAPGATIICPDSSRARSRDGPPRPRVSRAVIARPAPAGPARPARLPQSRPWSPSPLTQRASPSLRASPATAGRRTRRRAGDSRAGDSRSRWARRPRSTPTMAAVTRSDYLERFADLVVRVGVNVQPGGGVLVSADIAHLEIARAVVERAYAAGAEWVEVDWSDGPIRHSRLAHASLESLKKPRQWAIERTKELAAERAVAIRLSGDPDPHLFDDIDPAKAAAFPMEEVMARQEAVL